jgi:hypothetical protein
MLAEALDPQNTWATDADRENALKFALKTPLLDGYQRPSQ